MTIQEIFEGMKATFAERNKTYGDSYRQTGVVLQALFPKGLTLEPIDEWQRFGAFFMIICKAVRYAEQLKSGGHVDSAHDSAVYSAILEELTRGATRPREPIATGVYRFFIRFKEESPLAKKFAILCTSIPWREDAMASARSTYGENVLSVENYEVIKIKDTLGLDEIQFGEGVEK